MSRTVPASLAAMYATRLHTRAWCFYAVLRDGSVLAFTDAATDLLIDLSFSSGDPVIFRANASVKFSDISTTAGLSTDSCEISGPISDYVTETAIHGRRFNRARLRIFEVDWTKKFPDPDASANVILFGGNIADCHIEGQQFTFECRSLTDRYNQTIGRTLSPYCSADFGDILCKVVRDPYVCTVAEEISNFRFRCDLGGAHADSFFTFGHAAFETGSLAGAPEMEVFAYTGATGLIELLAPMADPPQVGDLLTLYRGCSKLMLSADPAVPTCVSYDNAVNNRGFPEVPGSDVFLKVAVPGAEGA